MHLVSALITADLDTMHRSVGTTLCSKLCTPTWLAKMYFGWGHRPRAGGKVQKPIYGESRLLRGKARYLYIYIYIFFLRGLWHLLLWHIMKCNNNIYTSGEMWGGPLTSTHLTPHPLSPALPAICRLSCSSHHSLDPAPPLYYPDFLLTMLRISSTPKTLAPHPPETFPFLFPYRWGGPLTSTHLTPHPLSPALPAICRLSCSSHHSLDPAPPLYYPDFLLTMLRISSTPKTLAPHPPETFPFLFPYRWGGPLTSTHLTPHPLSPALPAICRLSCSSHHSLDPAPPLYYPDFLLTMLRISSTPKTLAPHPPETLPFLFPYRWGGPLTSTHLTPHPLSPALPAICRLSCSSHHSLDPAPPLYYPDFLLTMPPALTAMPSPSHHPLQNKQTKI